MSSGRWHVDVNIVEDDVLDLSKAATLTQFDKANFKLNPHGKFLCSFEIEKMSKRWFNVVNPDDIVEKYGADCFRMYEMSLGPLDAAKPWDTKGITGVQGFLRKLWRLCIDEQGALRATNESPGRDELTILHKAIRKAGEDIERLSMNTAVSTFMICVNDLTAAKCYKRDILHPLLVLIAPFAPFITEELWETTW